MKEREKKRRKKQTTTAILRKIEVSMLIYCL